MDEQQANDVGRVSLSCKRPTIIRPSSKSAVSQDEPALIHSASTLPQTRPPLPPTRPLPPPTRPSLHPHIEKIKPEFSLRPQTSVTGSIISLKAADGQLSRSNLNELVKKSPDEGTSPVKGTEEYQTAARNSLNPQRPPKPTIIIPHSRMQATGAEEKSKPAPPVRPSSTPRSNLLSSGTGQSPTAEENLTEATSTPASKSRLATTLSAVIKTPKRPPALLPGNIKSKIQSDADTHATDSVADHTTGAVQEHLMGSDSHIIGSEKGILSTPKPKPKPRPAVFTSESKEGMKEGIDRKGMFMKGESISNQWTLTNELQSNLSHGTEDEIILRRNHEQVFKTNDDDDDDDRKTNQREHDLSEEKSKRLTKVLLARFEPSVGTHIETRKSYDVTLHGTDFSSSETSQSSEKSVDSKMIIDSNINHSNANGTFSKILTGLEVDSAKVTQQESMDNVKYAPPIMDDLQETMSRDQVHSHKAFHTSSAHDSSMCQSASLTSTEIQELPNQIPGIENNKAPLQLKHGRPPRPAAAFQSSGKSAAFSEKQSLSTERKREAEITQVPQSASSQLKKKAAESPLLPGRPGPGHPLYHYMSRQPHGIAFHGYTASQPDELSLSDGDVVVLVKEIDDQWMVGRVGSNEGMYPKAFTKIICPLITEMSQARSDCVFPTYSVDHKNSGGLSGPRCIARFDFEGEGENELTLKDGELIQITERVGTEWLRGEHRGRQGIFPSSFVEIIEDLQPDNKTREDLLSHHVSVLFDFDGKDGELNLKAGDNILVISQVNSEWLFGDCKGQRGLFPAAFISHVPQNLPEYEAHDSQKSSIHQLEQDREGDENSKTAQRSVEDFWDSRESAVGFCRAIYDYIDTSPGDLEFRVGDRIEILEFLGENWAKGRLQAKEGIFPLRLVAEEVNSPPRSPEPVPVKTFLGQVLHDFDGETEDDLVLKEGELLEVEEGFADVNKNWRWGTLNGKRGMFPAVFVQILD